MQTDQEEKDVVEHWKEMRLEEEKEGAEKEEKTGKTGQEIKGLEVEVGEAGEKEDEEQKEQIRKRGSEERHGAGTAMRWRAGTKMKTGARDGEIRNERKKRKRWSALGVEFWMWALVAGVIHLR